MYFSLQLCAFFSCKKHIIPRITTKIYAENIKTKHKVCILKTTTKYEETENYHFDGDDFDKVAESIYDWTIF